MQSLEWKDAAELASSKQKNIPPSKASAFGPWFGITMLLVGFIIGFITGNFINL